MSPGRVLLLMALLLVALSGCGRGFEVGDQATQAVATQSGVTPTVAEPAAVPTTVPTIVATEVEQVPAPEQPATPAQGAATEDTPAESTLVETAPIESIPTQDPAQATAGTPVEPTSQPLASPPPTVAPLEVAQAPDDHYTFDPVGWEDSLTVLSSFRQKVVLEFAADGTGAQSRVVYDGEVTIDPHALRSMLRIEGQAASELPSNQVEVIWIGDQAWVKVGRKPWIPVPVAALESEYAGQVVGVGDLLPFVPQALRVLPDETVNGISCKHYAYDLDDLPAESGMTNAQGDIWVAVDGGYVVRLTMSGQGTYYGTYSSIGTFNLIYDLYDVNAPVTIKPPR